MLTIYSSTSMLKITKPVLIHVAYCNSRKNKIKNHANCSKIKKPMMTTRLVRTPNIFLKICFIRAVFSPFFIQTLFCLSDSCISRSPAVMHSKQEMNHVIRHTTKAKLTAIPHKDCAADASSNFSSDETKSGVNTCCIHEHFCEI